MGQETKQLRIDYAEDDINYFNGFRNAVKLLNNSLQYLSTAADDVPDDHLRDTVKAWRAAADADMNSIVQNMYEDLKGTYGMALRVDADGGYFIKIDDGEEN
jgi:hypothetical protein